jgi:transcriptional regulator with XRE-family HTH domain
MSTPFDKVIQSFPEVIERVLKIEMLNASELSRRMGKHRSTISRYLNAEKNIDPNNKSIREINAALKKVRIVSEESGWRLVKNHDTDLLSAMESVERAEESVTAYKESMPPEDDPVRQIQFAKMLLSRAIDTLLNRREDS